jgi:hypothetical protein
VEPTPPARSKAVLRLRGWRPCCPPAREPRGPSAGIGSRVAEPWAGGAEAGWDGQAGGQARGRPGGQVRPRHAKPRAGDGARGFIVYARAPCASPGLFCTVRRFLSLRHSLGSRRAGSCAGCGRGASGWRFKMEMRAGAGRGRRAGADVRGPRAARPALPAEYRERGSEGESGDGRAQEPGWNPVARIGARPAP